eukprot:CAMPEP_0202920284 /NCGR_PEP_ID=MMETSP1392-20130828/76776_1 /ASSEMBLY_ACC=CAM_ASM_000868 /TAXON_ID=225041 /ORGANISM="Chlamydomonas chlamydogama, Strain SAG 11-48b" /LENGTH=524 /DNA_ID=CAMNT_0049613769 /DNA_START=404 /DNA_END=1978 /DNA_ORIENTATION=-
MGAWPAPFKRLHQSKRHAPNPLHTAEVTTLAPPALDIPDVDPKYAAPVVIIGGGPAGLATALMMARRGFTNIKVYERLAEPPAPDDLSVWGDFEQASERLYMIGLNGRGQAVLRSLGVLDRIAAQSSKVLGRMDWRPETPPDGAKQQRYTNRTYTTLCIQRGRLASCLLQEIREKYSHVVDVEFDVGCRAASWGPDSEGQEVCKVVLERQAGSSSSSVAASWVEESPFVIGADGAGSSLRSAMEAASPQLRVKRYEDKNQLVYRTIPLFWPKHMADTRPSDLNYSARTKSGINMDCLPTKEGPLIGVVLYKPGTPAIQKLKTKEDARAFFQETFPMFMPGLREIDLERFAQKGDSNLPVFTYTGPVLHHGNSACLVGDTIHTVKPYFGQGVNSAFEDIKVLEQALEETGDDFNKAVPRYSTLRAKDAEALVVLSESLDGGFLTFVGPLILDSMLHRMLPWLFSPNIIASLQNEKWQFSQIRQRKKVDRALQVALLAAIAAVVVKVLSVVVMWASRLIGKLWAGA